MHGARATIVECWMNATDAHLTIYLQLQNVLAKWALCVGAYGIRAYISSLRIWIFVSVKGQTTIWVWTSQTAVFVECLLFSFAVHLIYERWRYILSSPVASVHIIRVHIIHYIGSRQWAGFLSIRQMANSLFIHLNKQTNDTRIKIVRPLARAEQTRTQQKKKHLNLFQITVRQYLFACQLNQNNSKKKIS